MINHTMIGCFLAAISVILAIGIAIITYYIIKSIAVDEERIRISRNIREIATTQLEKINLWNHINKKISTFLSRYGANYLMHKRVKAGGFILLCIVMASVLFTVFRIIFGVLEGTLAGIIGCILPIITLYINNKSDNSNMLKDINSMYDALCTQTAAGMYLGRAIKECSTNVNNLRLKTALMELNVNLEMSRMDIPEALEDFNMKFKNNHLDMLVLVLEQSLKSGQASQYLKDLQDQMADVQHTIEIKRESSTDMKLNIVQLLIYVSIIAVVIIALGSDLMKSLSDVM